MRTPEQELAEYRLNAQSYHREALRYAVEVLEGQSLIPAPHHKPLCDALDAVLLGDIKRLIVSISPGFGKTLSVVIALMARGYLVNPACRFLHTSYSAELALSNSAKVRELLMSDVMQALGAPQIKDTSRAKGLWETDQGGTVRAVQSGGGITGFRAGHMTPGFSGAALIDDPNKPADASSRTRMSEVNRNYNATIASRLAHEDVPIIVIQQRIAQYSDGDELDRCGDLSEYLLRGGSGETWDHLILPAIVDSSQTYPKEWTHGKPIKHNLPDGPLWPKKLSQENCDRLKSANSYVWAAQYQQRPKARTGEPLIDGKWFRRYAERPVLRTIHVFADTASKTGERNDYSVFLVAGRDHEDNLYVLDMVRGKYEMPELHQRAADVWAKWSEQGATAFHIEDASSGTGLIQSLKQTLRHTVRGIKRTRDKFTRVSSVIEPISSGRVWLPESAPWAADLVSECEDFTDDDSHAHDDIVDTLTDAIETMILGDVGPATTTFVAGAF